MTMDTTALTPVKPGFRLVKAEVKELTPEIAEYFRNLEPSPTERELNAARVKHLREKADAGQLITFQWSQVQMGSHTLRMNGQHSSNMLCALNGAFPKGLKVHLDTYEADTEGDLAILFRQFDDRKSSRTSGDVAGAYQGLHSEVRDVPRAPAKLAIDGVAWFKREIDHEAVPSGDDRYQMFARQNLHGFIRWIGDLFSIKTPELKRQTIVTAMYGTFVANEATAKQFWSEVARGGVEYEEAAPQTVLDGWLKSLSEGAKKDRPELKPGQFYQGCVYAWNAYRDDRTIQAIKCDTKKGFHNITE
jgi:hypothetical protein